MKKFGRAILILSLVMMVAMTVSAQDDSDACMNKGGEWDASASKCTIKSGFEIDVNYPLFISQYPFAQKIIESFISDYKTQFAQSYTPVDDVPVPDINFWTLSMDYQEFKHGSNLISLLFTTSTYTGGAHPNSDLQSFTFDVKAGKQITQDDLFIKGSNPWPTIDQMVEQSLTTQLTQAFNAPMTDDLTQMMKSGTGTDPQNYQVFVIDGDSLVFHFPPYQVAPYVAGPQSVSIPLSSLSTFINPDVIDS